MKIFFDTEFTGLHQNTTLMSIGLITEDGRTFYRELTDYDKSQVDTWIKINVVSNFIGSEEVQTDMETLKKELVEWLEEVREDRPIEMVSDCLAYDWVLFNQIFGHAFNIPGFINYIPTDISTMFRDRGIDPDISREIFINEYNISVDGEKHNALYDAKVIKACYDILKKIIVLDYNSEAKLSLIIEEAKDALDKGRHGLILAIEDKNEMFFKLLVGVDVTNERIIIRIRDNERTENVSSIDMRLIAGNAILKLNNTVVHDIMKILDGYSLEHIEDIMANLRKERISNE